MYMTKDNSIELLVEISDSRDFFNAYETILSHVRRILVDEYGVDRELFGKMLSGDIIVEDFSGHMVESVEKVKEKYFPVTVFNRKYLDDDIKTVVFYLTSLNLSDKKLLVNLCWNFMED